MNRSMILRMREVIPLLFLAEVRCVLRVALRSWCLVLGEGSRPPGEWWEARMVTRH